MIDTPPNALQINVLYSIHNHENLFGFWKKEHFLHAHQFWLLAYTLHVLNG